MKVLYLCVACKGANYHSYNLGIMGYFLQEELKQGIEKYGFALFGENKERACVPWNFQSRQYHIFIDARPATNFPCMLLIDGEYPQSCLPAFVRMVQEAEPTSQQDVDQLLQRAQEPKEFDKIYKVQTTLDDVKMIMYKNIDEMLERGEKIDSLVQKSEHLRDNGRQFYRRARETNRCCRLY